MENGSRRHRRYWPGIGNDSDRRRFVGGSFCRAQRRFGFCSGRRVACAILGAADTAATTNIEEQGHRTGAFADDYSEAWPRRSGESSNRCALERDPFRARESEEERRKERGVALPDGGVGGR